LPIHPQAQEFLDTLHASGEPPLIELTPEQARAAPAIFAELTGPGPEVASVRDVSIPVEGGAIGARVYEPVPDPPGTVVYYHGGGWVIGSPDGWDAVCRVLAVSSGCRVVSVDYRLAPEHRFPVAHEDSYTALLWTAEHLAGGKPIVVAGDSAGGNLAGAIALRARDENGPELALQLLVYPIVDADYTTSSYVEHGDSGLLVGLAEMKWFLDHYVPDDADRTDPRVAILHASDHSGLPPAYVVLAEYDPLLDEGLAYAEKLRAAGVPVTVKRYDDQIHVFFTLVNFFETADVAVADASEAIRQAVTVQKAVG
jgi:acetyl esterase/lipase